jgi:hypothetical protein
MEHIKLNAIEDYTYVDMTLYLGDVKILYNACIDIIKEHPEMIGYEQTAKKLFMVIENYNNK